MLKTRPLRLPRLLLATPALRPPRPEFCNAALGGKGGRGKKKQNTNTAISKENAAFNALTDRRPLSAVKVDGTIDDVMAMAQSISPSINQKQRSQGVTNTNAVRCST